MQNRTESTQDAVVKTENRVMPVEPLVAVKDSKLGTARTYTRACFMSGKVCHDSSCRSEQLFAAFAAGMDYRTSCKSASDGVIGLKSEESQVEYRCRDETMDENHEACMPEV